MNIILKISAFSNQEPAFEELILLYTEEVSEGESKYKSEVPSLQLKIYERIPIPDLPVNHCDTYQSSRVMLGSSYLYLPFCSSFFMQCLKDFLMNFHMAHVFAGCFSSQKAIFPYHRHGMNS